MIIWSRSRILVAGAALILIVNAVALAGVAYNRSGEPDSILHLTQRELQMPYSWRSSAENSGIALTLSWRVPVEETVNSPTPLMYYPSNNGFPAWLDKTKLESLGFDVSGIKAMENGGRHYNKLLSKEAFLVMELDGPAYQQTLEHVRQYAARAEVSYTANAGNKVFEQQATNAKNNAVREEQESSRLFVVDAGLDIGTLRAKYPDRTRYAIIRGQVRPQLAGQGKDQRLIGYVSSFITQINVPVAFRQVFERLPQRSRTGMNNPSERYEAEVAFGKRLEPWLTAVSGKAASK